MARTLCELASRDTRLMPQRDPPVTEIVRVIVRDTGGLAGSEHRPTSSRRSRRRSPGLEAAREGKRILGGQRRKV